ncbi:uncharacterized protein LOC110833911 isoform X4 [Zootermopsis nevadensis]|nr:uncharacterized protein LOC110833911 isoform X4 [Zootermopsis nevadensis]
MEKEKNETEPEIDETVDIGPGMKEGDVDNANLESFKLDATVEDVMDKSEEIKEVNNAEKLLPAASEEEVMDESVNSTDEVKEDPTVEFHEVDSDVDVQEEKKDSEVQSTKKMSVDSCKSRPDSGEVKNGDTSEVNNKKDKELPVEDKVPVGQSSQHSQAVNSVTGSYNSNTNTLSTVFNTRSTRSQNPEFVARHRHFLHKVHLASNNVMDEELLTDDESTTSKTTSKSSDSVQTEDNSSVVVDSVAVRRKRERSASNGTLSPRIPSPSVTVMIGGSVSGNNSGSSSPAGSQMQSVAKRRRSVRTDSTGTQQESPVPALSPIIGSSTDRFCWLCHKDGIVISCETCPRVYHLRCIQLEAAPTEDWVCPECITILHAENTDTRSRAMKLLSIDQLCNLLKYAMSRMKTHSGAEPFWKAVDVTEFPQYREYVAHPMDLSLLERNIKKRLYGSTEAFIADTKWVLHNCIIFNTYQSRLTGVAKVLVKICKQEMAEIENCPDCYLNAHTRKDSWFIEVCRKPHVLVWAKLKGFPFWPAKVMRTNKEGMVDVRFFGAHDRAWVPVRECYLYSKAMPASARNKKRNNLDACIQEVEEHTKKLQEKFGVFEHASFRTRFDPAREREQLCMLLPSYNDDDEGQPSSKRNKILGEGYTVRSYYCSRQSEREAQERNKTQASDTDELNTTIESDKSADKRSRGEKRKNWDSDRYSEDGKKSHSCKRTAIGSRLRQWDSSSSEDSQESDDGTQQDVGISVGVEGSSKSASLIEWSKFEESAAKLTVGVEGGASDEDKLIIASENINLSDTGDTRDRVLPCNGAKVKQRETDYESSEVEKSARVTASEVVKKVLAGSSIADKLQEKLFRLERSSKDCKDNEETSPEVISESMSVDQESSAEVVKNTENCSGNPEDCEISSVCANENDVKNLKPEMSSDRTRKDKDDDAERNSVTCHSSGSEQKRGRSETPVVNKTPLKAETRYYGKQYSPKVVLYNLVLPAGKLLQGKARNITNEILSVKKPQAKLKKCSLSVAEPKKVQEKVPEECHTKKVTLLEDNGTTSSSETLVKNKLEVSVHKTDRLHGSESIGKKFEVVKEDSNIEPESQSGLFPSSHKLNVVETDKFNVVGCNAPTGVKMKVAVSDNTSESGESDIVMDSSKRTPEHGYSRCCTDNFLENGAKMLEPMQDTKSSEQRKVLVEKNLEHDGDQSSEYVSETVKEKGSVLESVQETLKKSEDVQNSLELEAELSVGMGPVSEKVAANESPPDDRGALCGSLSKNIACNSVSNPGNADLVPVEQSSDREPPPEEANANKVLETDSIEQSVDKVSDSTSKMETCGEESKDGRTDSVANSNNHKDNSEVPVKLNTPQNTVLKVYPAKTNKALDKKIKDCKASEMSRTEALVGSDVTITPAALVSAPTEQEDEANKTATSVIKETDDSSIADKKIKEEPLDPDDLVAESSSSVSTLVLSSAQCSAKTSPELKLRGSPSEKKEADSDNFNKGKIIFSKKLPLAVLEDKERLASNESPSSVSEKDGIFPSLFLDPSITITVINDKQADNVDVPVLGKSKVSSSDINVNELRASVNLSKDISLTVVGTGYGGHSNSAKGISSSSVTPLEMECGHESDHDNSRNASVNATSASIPVAAQNAVVGHNSTNRQKKQKCSVGSNSLQARSRARKSFPNRPVFPNVKVKSHPELVNGVGTFGNKSSVVRRNSVGTNSNSSDSRRSSYGTSPQEMLITAQQLGDASGSDSNNNNSGSAMVALPHVLGNPTTNHIQALRTVNNNIGAPSHIVNSGPDMMPSRMVQAPHNQPHSVGNGTRISPAGQGPGAAAAASRMPPQLQPRPPGPLLSQHPPPIPLEAGPVSAELNRHAHKLSDFLRTTVEEILRDLSNIGNPEATIKSLQLELEKLQWRHNQEMAEMKHNTDLMMMEMRASVESERQRAVAETIRQCELEKQRAVEETKKKQWCTNCGKEALFYCCWNTSYCDYPCQQRHWPQHMSTCAQNTQQGGEGNVREGDIQQNNPHTSGGSSNNKPSASQQQQPWLDSVPIFKSATSSAGNLSLLSYHGLCNKTGNPSPSLTYQVGDEDYDNNNNSYEAVQHPEGRQETEPKENSGLRDLSGMNMDGHRLQKKRKRCGKCKGCTTVGNCGQCPPCNSTRTHQVCRQRRCSNLLMETALVVPSPAIKRSHINVQQKLQQVASNGPNGGKPPIGPPPSYSGTVMAQTQRNMGAAIGRVAAQYAGLLPMARPTNMQISEYSSDQIHE